ncbi:hypothetical protein M2137_001860 [Parabacteroides sp. PFB2-10]|uniref:hypothetical protein n=1 Tax=Parabacteroides sp. PFB2-10 TaxID=1742405 RepID=UPI002474FD00|nr:hypothetical protein [Parabacteroides sp. PFB2-10]MDH6313073.1 hypothetical protein [Parabacteroides sp. PFB2-10]MDL2245013.1 hypothetical protein [Parabacteroides sp. OttesenSCG-928-J18]MDL2282485.1 hypothetical protein [Parabacteroides sp. OttesenSCG-928-G06]
MENLRNMGLTPLDQGAINSTIGGNSINDNPFIVCCRDIGVDGLKIIMNRI